MSDLSEVLDCRRNHDRRAPMSFFCAYHLGIKAGRRMSERRTNTRSRQPAYVDRYANHLLLCAVGILLLSTCDAIFTLGILANGGVELNAFMDVLIKGNIEKFFNFKIALTSLGIILLVIHQDVQLAKKIRVRHLKYTILAGYLILIGYEIHLLQLAAI